MFPELNRLRKSSTYISVFRGLNRTPNAGFARVNSKTSTFYTELTQMKNLCGDDFPRLRTRKNRSYISASEIASNILFVNSHLIFLSGSGYLVVNMTPYPFYDFEDGEHFLSLYGNHVVIMPEHYVFNLTTHQFAEIDFSYTSQTVDSSTLNSARFNTNGRASGRTMNFKDFSIEKVELDDSGAPRPVNYIYEKASGLEDYSKQTNPGNDTSTQDDIAEQWQREYYHKWGTIRAGETVEAQGESPSGVYRCTDVMKKEETINGVQYVTQNGLLKFVKIENYYVKISRNAAGESAVFDGIKKGDWVKISGMTHSVVSPLALDNNGNNWSSNDWGNYINVLNNNSFKVYYADENCIVIKANIEKSVPYNGAMTIERIMPTVDSGMMLEVNNRLWACSSANNEIYSCKQGDVTNWQAFGDGISTDSYAATVGCEGEFTGIARQNDSVIFFKENWIIKLFGTKPSNFTLATYNVPGVERGSQKSIVWVNGVLYYLSHMGVCQYSPGSQPVVISERAFGNVKYKNGVGGRHHDKYFLSVQDETDNWHLFVYDTRSGLWHEEDNTHMIACATYNNVLYWLDETTSSFFCADAENNLLSFPNVTKRIEETIEWNFETPDLYDNDFRKKYISKIQIAVKGASDMTVKIYAQYKKRGAWYMLRELRALQREHCIIHVPVRRADFLRLRLEGRGKCEISGIQIDYSGGSEKVWQY